VAELVPRRAIWPAVLFLIAALAAVALTVLMITPHGFDAGVLNDRWQRLLEQLPW
jgi:hypothetical protein